MMVFQMPENQSQNSNTMASTAATTLVSTSGHKNYTWDDLESVNNERALTLLPAMIVLGILMIIGIVGNCLVCYIFCFRLRSGTQNFLIVCLAVLDLLSCLIAIPNEIADMRFYFDFQSAGACKIMRFINTFCAIGSIFTLLVIAIDRYRKICKPFLGQLQMTHVKLSLIPIFGGALFFGWPAFVMYGLRTTETGVPGLYGQDCSTPDDISDTIYPLLYNCVLFLCFIILAITLIILYTFVLRETKRHNRYLKRNSDYNIPSSGQYYSEDSHSGAEVTPEGNPSPTLPPSSDDPSNRTVQFAWTSNSSIVTSVDDAPASQPSLVSVSALVDSSHDESHNEITPALSPEHASSLHSETANSNIPNTDLTLPSQQINGQPPSDSSNLAKNSSLVSSNSKRKKDTKTVLFHKSVPTRNQTSIKNRERIKSKTTLIAFLVTLVFILSFLPHLCLQVAKLLNKGFDYNLRGSALVAYNVFLRSYFINSVSNPIIYGVLNVHFSKEVTSAAKKMCRKS